MNYLIIYAVVALVILYGLLMHSNVRFFTERTLGFDLSEEFGCLVFLWPLVLIAGIVVPTLIMVSESRVYIGLNKAAYSWYLRNKS